MISSNKSVNNVEKSSEKQFDRSFFHDNGDPQAKKIWILENNITFLKSQHQEMLIALQNEIDMLKEKNIDLQRRLVLESGNEVIVNTTVYNDELIEVNSSVTVEELRNKISVLKDHLKLAQDANILLQKELETRRRHSAALRHNIAKNNSPVIQKAEQVKTTNLDFRDQRSAVKKEDANSKMKISFPDFNSPKGNTDANHSNLTTAVIVPSPEFIHRPIDLGLTSCASNSLSMSSNFADQSEENLSENKNLPSAYVGNKLPPLTLSLPSKPTQIPRENVASFRMSDKLTNRSHSVISGSAKSCSQISMLNGSTPHRSVTSHGISPRISDAPLIRSAHGRIELRELPIAQKTSKAEITPKLRVTLPAIRKTSSVNQELFKRKSLEFQKRNMAPRQNR